MGSVKCCPLSRKEQLDAKQAGFVFIPYAQAFSCPLRMIRDVETGT